MPRGKEKKLTCTFYLNGEPVDKLPEEALDKMAENFGRGVSEYYQNHPEEWLAVKDYL